MHKVLQALVDTILLAAGSVELGSAAYSPADHARDMGRRSIPTKGGAAAKPRRAPSDERAGPQPSVREPALQTNSEKSQL